MYGVSHLFQGRYKSLIVEDESYGMILCRYIHLNPVKTKDFSEYTLAAKRNALRKFKWSSYPMLIGLRKAPEWKNTHCFSAAKKEMNQGRH